MKHTDDFIKARDFIMAYLGPKSKYVLSEETRLEKDLGITGDDALELLQSFTEKFDIDASNFDFTKYFDAEGLMINFSHLFRILIGEKTNRHTIPMTIGFLANAIRTGKLE